MTTIIQPEDLPPELDLRDHGFVMRGWDFSRMEMAAAVNDGRMLNPTFEGMTNYCPWNCDYCYTERDSGPNAQKRRLANELTLARRLEIIREAAQLGAKSMNFIGAGEPTIDPNFWEIVETVATSGMTPIVFTEASLRLTDEKFARRLYDLGATVVIKVNSLFNADYQNAVVAGNQVVDPTYFNKRNDAIELCAKIGFNRSMPTRLGFDTIITSHNYEEIHEAHLFTRLNNIFVVLKNYLFTGRVKEARKDLVSQEDQKKLWNELARIDEEKFGLKHDAHYPFGGSHPCTLRSTGVHIAITGDVFRCDGEDTAVGDLRTETLKDVWERVRHIDQNIMGLCPPRDRAFATYVGPPGRRLPVVP